MKEKQRRRPTAVEKHPKRKEIEKALAEDEQIETISRKYGISRNALIGYKRHRIPRKMVKAAERKSITDAEHLFQIILKAVQRMEILSDSCDEYLQDPDNPGSYYMGPRAHEVKVVYYRKGPQGGITKHTTSLQNLIAKMEEEGMVDPQLVSYNTDPRILLVKASETLTKQMDTLVNAWRAIDQGKNTFVGTPAWNEVVQVILKATESHPEIRRKIADGLSKITG